MSDNLSQMALLNALATPTSDNLHVSRSPTTVKSDNLHVSRSPTTVKSDNLSIVNIFFDIGVLFLSETAEYQP